VRPDEKGKKVMVARLLRNNGLTLVMFGLAAIFVFGLTLTGARVHSDDQVEHGQPAEGYTDYVTSGDFAEAMFENWESEFLQMGCYVLFTVWLVQRGASESKDPDARSDVDEDPSAHRHDPGAPWPVRRGGLALRLYQHSLSTALLMLFVLSFVLHAWGGARAYSQEEQQHGGKAVTAPEFVTTAKFWEEAFQNWQSEFFSIGMLLVLSIRLRDRGSPESKPVHATHASTGS
jgi:hypothetical protein